jgi:hypothetical protein
MAALIRRRRSWSDAAPITRPAILPSGEITSVLGKAEMGISRLNSSAMRSPAARLSFPPGSVRPETAGSGGRCPAGKIAVPGMLDELAGEECTSEQPATSKATVAPATTRTAGTRRDTAEIYKV